MTYANGAPHPGDGRAYSDGGLVGHDVQVDLERRHQQLKLLRELEDAARRNKQQQQQQPRPVYSRHPTPVPRLSVGPVIWNALTTAPASSSSSSSVSVSSSAASAIAGRAPVLQTTKQQQQQQQQQQEQEQQQRRRFAAASAGHVAPSIHTILEIARSSSGSHGQPSSSSMPLTNTSRYYSKNPDQQHRQRPSASSEVRGGSSSSAGVIPGPRRPAHKAPEERDQVSRQQKGSSIPTASASGVVPSPPPQQPVGTVGTFGGSGTTTTATTTEWSTPLRRGKWTKAEEEFAAATIRYFCGGLLNLQFGTLLRGFLAQQLHCHPMRISKKLLPGTTFCGVEISRKLGRRAYSPRWCDSPLATQQKLDAEDHLVELRAKFIASIEEEAAADSDELGEETRELCRAAERLSETSESRASTGTASAAGSPPSDVKSETTRAGSPAVLQQQQRYHHHQQASQQQQPQMYQYNQQQQQQVVGQKRTRGDNEWAAAEQAQPPRTHQHHHQQQQQVHHHHNQHQPQHPMHHQHQHSLYIPSQTTNQRWGASPPVRSGPPQIWHSSSPSPSPPRTPPLPSAALAGAHAPTQPTSYYETVPRPAKLPRLHHHQQQQQQTQHQQYHQQVSENVHEPQRSSAPSPPSTLPLLPSLRASLQRASTYQDQQQQQQQGHQQHPHQQHRL